MTGILDRILARMVNGALVDVDDTNPLPVKISGANSQVTLNVAEGDLAPINTATGATATTLGGKTDAKSTATDTTAVSAMSVWKQEGNSLKLVAHSESHGHAEP